MSSFYNLTAAQTVWADDCSGCPNGLELDNSALCARTTWNDSRCFRGDFGAENDWFTYNFKLPPEWNVGESTPVRFHYTATYWSLGTWLDEKKGKERGGSLYCSGSQNIADCTLDFNEKREEKNTCAGAWNKWNESTYVGDFHPYKQWPATAGDTWDTPCYWQLSYSHPWTASQLKVGFRVYDENKDGSFGLHGDRQTVAWVVSDFQIDFTPFATATTSSTSASPQTTVSQTTGAPQTTVSQTTGPPVTTSNASRTTESGGGGGNSNSGVDSLIIIIAAVGAAVLIALVAAVVYWYKYIKTPSIKDLMTRGVDNKVDIKIEAAHREGEQVMAETLAIHGETEGVDDYQQDAV